jgi:tryptophan synthase beta subunit
MTAGLQHGVATPRAAIAFAMPIRVVMPAARIRR